MSIKTYTLYVQRLKVVFTLCWIISPGAIYLTNDYNRDPQHSRVLPVFWMHVNFQCRLCRIKKCSLIFLFSFLTTWTQIIYNEGIHIDCDTPAGIGYIWKTSSSPENLNASCIILHGSWMILSRFRITELSRQHTLPWFPTKMENIFLLLFNSHGFLRKYVISW